MTGIAGTTMSMTYHREIELVFDVASFQPHQPNSRIDLWYIADNRDTDPEPKTADKDFFVESIRDHVRALPQSRTKVHDVLRIVSEAWDKCNFVSSQVKHINVTFPTIVCKTSDSTVAVKSSLLLVPLETRVEVTLKMQGRGGPEGVIIGISPEAKVLYGETFNIAKIKEFISTRIGEAVGAKEEAWSNVLVELHQKLIARGKK